MSKDLKERRKLAWQIHLQKHAGEKPGMRREEPHAKAPRWKHAGIIPEMATRLVCLDQGCRRTTGDEVKD